jgi:hypothetical protein
MKMHIPEGTKKKKDLKRPEFVKLIGFCEDRFRGGG